MRVEFSADQASHRGKCAFTIIETLVGLCILIVVLVSLFGGISAGFSLTQVCRENLRATQIMLERMETVRLYTWNQLLYSNLIPASATTSYYPLATNGESSGITYRVNYALANAAMTPSAAYSDRLRAVTVTVWWTNYYGPKPQTNTIVRSRTMTTYSARDGVQNYVYNN